MAEILLTVEVVMGFVIILQLGIVMDRLKELFKKMTPLKPCEQKIETVQVPPLKKQQRDMWDAR